MSVLIGLLIIVLLGLGLFKTVDSDMNESAKTFIVVGLLNLLLVAAIFGAKGIGEFVVQLLNVN